MANDHSAAASDPKRRHRHEGPQKHVVAFVLSLVLTIIAFAAVSAGEINTTFTYIILVSMALLQVFVQLAFWMHLKDRGHLFATMGIVFGIIVVITMVIMALYWVWW